MVNFTNADLASKECRHFATFLHQGDKSYEPPESLHFVLKSPQTLSFHVPSLTSKTSRAGMEFAPNHRKLSTFSQMR